MKNRFKVWIMKFEINSVDRIYPEEDSCVIAITQKEVSFSVPFLHLKFDDVGQFAPNFIEEKHVEKLRSFLPTVKKSKKVYVGCDMGRRRSPATALAVAEKLEYKKDVEYIREVYKLFNYDVYDFIKERL